MDREKKQVEFGKQLENLGFKLASSTDHRVRTYLLVGGLLNSRQNFRTEINLDFYGWKIVYYQKQFLHFTQSERWQEDDHITAKDHIEKFLQSYYL